MLKIKQICFPDALNNFNFFIKDTLEKIEEVET
jgi:hypothetical protein